MFDIGFTELILVGVIGLLILGPERMPIAVRTVGMWVGKVKRTLGGVQKEIQDELRIDDIRKKADANRKAIEGRMQELQEETELMEAPVVAAASVAPTESTDASEEAPAVAEAAAAEAQEPVAETATEEKEAAS
ncbi:MAG TPA: twin-arginine translocase subunit TatB [Oceanospirillaceae bacterium]|jgi:sec-independent protein translocase protein TatB|nr:twin-arginine translocase subunit TatB [Oceanospirillaceae bacterium]